MGSEYKQEYYTSQALSHRHLDYQLVFARVK